MANFTQEDVIEFARMFQKLGQVYNRTITDELREAYWVALQSHPWRRISKALAALQKDPDRKRDSFPTPNEILRYLRDLPYEGPLALPEPIPTPDPDAWKRGQLTLRWGQIKLARGEKWEINDKAAIADLERFVEFYWDDEKVLGMSLTQVEEKHHLFTWREGT